MPLAISASTVELPVTSSEVTSAAQTSAQVSHPLFGYYTFPTTSSLGVAPVFGKVPPPTDGGEHDALSGNVALGVT